MTPLAPRPRRQRTHYGAGMAASAPEWRTVDDALTAWFDAPSLAAGAAVAARVVEIAADAAVDVRATGARVRLDGHQHAAAVSAAAADLGLAANPAVLAQVSVVVESTDPVALEPFWRPVLGYQTGAGGTLTDPLRRDPPIRIERSAEARPLRNRLHLDVVRPAAAIEPLGLGNGGGPYGLCHTDADGNEVDVVPGDPLGDRAATADWQLVFGAVACYRTTSVRQQVALVARAASLADAAGFPMLIDLRPGLVVIDSGKDRADPDAHGLDLDFLDLAGQIQIAARELRAKAAPELARFVQVFLDAADVGTVRCFWTAALGYVPDRRDGLTDIVDPRGLNPVLVFQQLDATDAARRRQRSRIRLQLAVPAEVAESRLASALNADGQVLDEAADRWHLADPEGNELVIVGAR